MSTITKITKESDILDENIRKLIIREILSVENNNRKHEAYKAYQCYKDNTKEYVVRMLKKQFDPETVDQMSYSITNLAFVRKAIDKLARVYKYGVERESDSEDATNAIKEASKISKVDQCFKKTNRYLKLTKNCLQYIVPKKIGFDDEEELYTIKPIAMPPYLYDVVELPDDREKLGVVILSDYIPTKDEVLYKKNPALRIQEADSTGNYPLSDQNDSVIADDPRDQKNNDGNFIFWSKNYHFTCNKHGEIISIETENPIGMLPFVNYAEDQDGCFWARGGEDLVDGGVTLNCMVTNIQHIAIQQGYGQIVMSGANLPRNLKIGPDKIVYLERKNTEEPEPKFEFATANPPLDQLRGLVEMYCALLLTTNNLSTSGVSTQLNGGSSFPSGIAMMLDKSESLEDIEDQRQIFIDNEPEFWKIYSEWHRLYKSQKLLEPSLDDISFPDNFEITVKFGQPKPIITEKERLEIIKQKLEMNLIGKLDALRSEYPNMDDEQLKKKLEELIEEKSLEVIEKSNNDNSPDPENEMDDDVEDTNQENDVNAEEKADEETE